MPLTLHAGITKKIGLPYYGSFGASCQVEIELEAGLLHHDLESFHRHVKAAFLACRQAVNDELAREQASNKPLPPPHTPTNVQDSSTRTARLRDRTRPITASQIRALEAISQRQQLDLAAVVETRFGTRQLAEITITEASQLIQTLTTPTTPRIGGAA